jgi:hypothetical protein
MRMLDDGRRLEALAAIGIDVYRLRPAGSADVASATAPALPERSTSAAGPARLVVAGAHGAGRDPGFARLLSQLLHALDVADAVIRRIETAADGSLAELPDAPAYLMIGTPAARACSAQLSIEQQNAATLVVIDGDPARLPRDAGGKRTLWQLLKPLARRLRTG